MKHILYIFVVVIGLMTIVAHAGSGFAGVSYRVDVTHGGAPAIADGCMHFADDGRFSMTGDMLTMLWAAEAHDPGAFVAVTAPGDRSIVPYQVGVFGTLQDSGGFSGSGIDEFGNTFSFVGHPDDKCGRDYPEARPPGVDPADVSAAVRPWKKEQAKSMPATTANRYDNLVAAIFAPVPDPCWSLPCDPPLNPLADPHRDASSPEKLFPAFERRSFRLTLGTSGNGLREYCWYFDDNGKVGTATGETLRWSSGPAAAGYGHFQLVGTGKNGRGMTYRGTLVGPNLLQTVGLEAFDGERTPTYGYGRAVERCE